MTNIKNERDDRVTDFTDIKKIRKHYKQLYTSKFYNLNKRKKFLERHKLPKSLEKKQIT